MNIFAAWTYWQLTNIPIQTNLLTQFGTFAELNEKMKSDKKKYVLVTVMQKNNTTCNQANSSCGQLFAKCLG